MTERLTPTTLRLYRQLRAGHPPEEAIELLRGHVRMAREYAIAAPYLTHAADLRDQESHLTVWLQDVRVRADRDDRHGAFWRTGFSSDPLTYVVQAWGSAGPMPFPVECDNPGCAIKHAVSMFCDEAVSSVTIDCNRPNASRRISRGTTMALLAEYTWPVA